MDWMGFYLAWNTQGTNKSTLAHIADSYTAACGGRPCGMTNSVPFISLQAGATNALGGAVSAEFANFTRQSSAYGVSTDTAP